MFPSLKAHTSDHLLVFPFPFFRFHFFPPSEHYLFCFLLSPYSSSPVSCSIQRNRNLESICRWPLSLAPGSNVHEVSHGSAMEESWGVGKLWCPSLRSLYCLWRLPKLGDGKVRAHYSIMSLFPSSPDIPDKGDCPESRSNEYTAHCNTETCLTVKCFPSAPASCAAR